MKEYNEKIQKIKMCIQTYFNLHGVMPSLQEMTDWLGASFQDLLPNYIQYRYAEQ